MSSIPTSTEFVFVRVRAIWSRAFAGERLESVIRKPSRPTLAAALGLREAELSNPELVERQAVTAHVDCLDKTRRCLESEMGAFYECLIGRHYLENLRLILRGRLSGMPAHEVQSLIIRSPGLPAMDVEKLLQATKGAEVAKRLPPHRFTKALVPLLSMLDSGKTLFEVESEMDRLFYAQALAAASALEDAPAACAAGLLKREVVAVNVLTVLRNVLTYHLPAEQLCKYLVPMPGMQLDESRLAFAGVTQAERIPEYLSKEYRERLAEVRWTDVRDVESALWRVLHDKARAAFYDFGEPEISLVAFPFIKRFELMNIRIAVEAVRLELSDAELAQHLSGGAYV